MSYFYTVSEEITTEIKIKRSRFITHLAKVDSMSKAKEYIHTVSKNYQTANHNCWAYVVGDKAENEHSSDAGEPSGSAGKPMLNALKKNNMTYVTAVVTRYFGGVKLGIRGLIEAYGLAVLEAISQKPLKKIVSLVIYQISTSYDFAEILKYQLNELSAGILDISYGVNVTLKIEVEDKLNDVVCNYLQEQKNKSKIQFTQI